MNFKEILIGIFIFLSLTLNFDFVYGDFDNLSHHSIYVLYFAIVVNIIGTILKIGDRTKIGSILVATSIVALIQLVFAGLIWSYYENFTIGVSDSNIFNVVSMASGALVANFLSVMILIIDTSRIKR